MKYGKCRICNRALWIKDRYIFTQLTISSWSFDGCERHLGVIEIMINEF